MGGMQVNLLCPHCGRRAKRLRISFDDTEKQDMQIQAILRTITSLFKETQVELKKVGTMGNEDAQKGLPYQERISHLQRPFDEPNGTILPN